MLSGHSAELEGSFTVENGAKYSSKKRKFDGDHPNSAAALLGGSASLPDGSYYCSLVVSRKPKLLAALVQSGDFAPPCFASSRVQQESALWFFVGRNSGSDALCGRPPHTDEVHNEGTYHRQLEGCKEWTLRPTEELTRRLGGRQRAGDEEAASTIVRCECGDVLCVSTRDWWHSTRLPPAAGEGGGVSVSVAREFNLRREEEEEEEEEAMPERMRRAMEAAAEEEEEQEDEEEEATSFINVDGLFAARAIPEGTVLFTEEDDFDVELPVEPSRANCEVVEDEETGLMAVVSMRDIRSGEFLCVGE